MNIRHRCVVLRHADIIKREKAVLSFEACEAFINKSSGDFSCSVGTEVKENNAVVCLDSCIFSADSRKNKFVRQILAVLVNGFVGSTDGGNRIAVLYTLAVNHSGIRLGNTFPAVVSVHGVISAHDGGNLADTDFLELFYRFSDIISA